MLNAVTILNSENMPKTEITLKIDIGLDVGSVLSYWLFKPKALHLSAS